MSTEAVATNHADTVVVHDGIADKNNVKASKKSEPTFLHSPPESNNTIKSDASDSELSDLDEEPVLGDAPMPLPVETNAHEDGEKKEVEEDIGEFLPDHWTTGVPIFKPTMRQFKDFKRFMEKVDSYGMKSGIIKIIPPQEWKDSLPEIDDLVKRVRVREPIKQDIMGSNGTYRQVNILHGRSYNIPQWRQLCEQSEHQPPARRGERRANAEKPRATRTRAAAAAAPKPATPSTSKPRGRGRPAKTRGRGRPPKVKKNDEEEDRPMTPVSPKPAQSIENDIGEDAQGEQNAAPTTVGRMGAVRQAKAKFQSVSARRKYSRREGSAMIDEEAFKGFDYRMDISDYTPERCEELERSYWKTLTYAQPLYGADLMGTLFDEDVELWNLNKLPNLLDVLGTKVPGVNTAYLYLGMWKATFAWHLEDVDLYSINFLHFGAPKQWYSISQADARRFEGAMKNVWPTDAKACDQFLRHKAFLISPQHLLSNYGIRVNKCVSYPGEFVVTYPYGYHSGYNLGYNCAEAVNFALDSWLDMGKIAKKCECAQAQDSVWVDVYEIERRLRGEETEYEETEDEEDEDEDEDEEMSGLPTPPASHGAKSQAPGRKRKRGPSGRKVKVKKIKLRVKSRADTPCCLCPNDFAAAELLPTDDGRKAHRMCALYLPETYIDTVDGKEIVSNAARIHKDRLDLKCLYCRSKRGACFQCSQKKCARAYHATCAAAAGVFIEEEEVPVFGEDGTEYKEQAFEFSCRFHRTKRDRKYDGDSLEKDDRVRTAAAALKPGEFCQLQYYRGDIFAGVVVENRIDEQTLLIDIVPNGDRLEIEWKWLLVPDPADYHLPKASANALPMPSSRKAKDLLNAKRHEDDKPRKDDRFGENLTWAEFQLYELARNKDQVKVDFAKPEQTWHYLGRASTEAKARYTDNPSVPRHNPKSNFLDTVPKPPRPVPVLPVQRPQFYEQPVPFSGQYRTAAPMVTAPPHQEKPYVYKPKKPIDPQFGAMGMFATQRFIPTPTPAPAPAPASMPQGPSYAHHRSGPNQGHQSGNNTSLTQRFEVKVAQNHLNGQYYSTAPSASAQASALAPAPAPAPANMPQHPVQHQWQRPNGPSNPPKACKMPPPAPAPVSFPGTGPPQPRTQTKPTWQVHSSIYQRYEFFQIYHNRDSSKYRTPYSPWGGFINGYQGDLRAHLIANQADLLKRSSISNGPPRPPSQGMGSLGLYHSAYSGSLGAVHQPPSSFHTAPHDPRLPTQHQPPPLSRPPVYTAPPQLLPPAIKAQYLPKSLNVPRQRHPVLPPAPKAKPSPSRPAPLTPNQPPQPAQRSYKIPVKESPVPLPANFLAAISSTPSTPAAADKEITKQVSKPQASSPGKGGTASAQTKGTPSAKAPQPPTPKISTTPIPIPKLPGMPSANSVQNVASEKMRTAETLMSISQMPLVQDGKAASVHNASHRDSFVKQMGIHTNGLPPHQALPKPDGFADVPGQESMEFMEKMLINLQKISGTRVSR